jgi:protein-S-isoprenylcysteine O-methyltransferase Ste14
MIDFLARRRVALGFVVALAAAFFARPTWESWRIGLIVAGAGEGLRIWAAGHLEKGREVTRSGPYRWTAHPLYVGSSVIAAGIAIASHSHVVVLLAAVYMGATITAAVRTEEAFLRRTFGPAYDDYRRSGGAAVDRPFSVERAVRNREYRAIAGLAIGFAFLALKVMLPI